MVQCIGEAGKLRLLLEDQISRPGRHMKAGNRLLSFWDIVAVSTVWTLFETSRKETVPRTDAPSP